MKESKYKKDNEVVMMRDCIQRKYGEIVNLWVGEIGIIEDVHDHRETYQYLVYFEDLGNRFWLYDSDFKMQERKDVEVEVPQSEEIIKTKTLNYFGV